MADPGDLDARLGEYRASAASVREDRIRSSVSLVVCALDVAALGLVAGQAHGVVRQIVGVAFCLVVPGWAIVGQLRLRNAPLEAGLVVAVSLACLLVVAQLAITFNAWHLTTVDVVVCVACLPSLIWQATAARRLRAPT